MYVHYISQLGMTFVAYLEGNLVHLYQEPQFSKEFTIYLLYWLLPYALKIRRLILPSPYDNLYQQFSLDEYLH